MLKTAPCDHCDEEFPHESLIAIPRSKGGDPLLMCEKCIEQIFNEVMAEPQPAN